MQNSISQRPPKKSDVASKRRAALQNSPSPLPPRQSGARRVLGIDPGLASTGWGVVDFFQNRFSLVKYGVIETFAGEAHAKRLLQIFSSLNKILDEFFPSEAAMETLFFAKNVTSAMGVAEARGVATLCLALREIPLFEYKPNQIKKAVTGSAAAAKADVEAATKLLLGLQKPPKPDHAADALAGAITHLNTCHIEKKLLGALKTFEQLNNCSNEQAFK